jgi:hypothetical protein
MNARKFNDDRQIGILDPYLAKEIFYLVAWHSALPTIPVRTKKHGPALFDLRPRIAS